MIRNIPFGICASALMLSLSSSSFAAPIEPWFTDPEVDRWMSDHIKSPTESLPVDQALAATARAASINVFADVSQIPADTIIEPYAQRPKDFFETNYNGRRNIIRYATRQADMTRDRVASDTFVFWRAPDKNRIVDLIARRQSELDAQFPPVSDKVAIEKIKDYYRDSQGWIAEPRDIQEKQASARGVKPVNISQIPLEVRVPLQAELIHQVRSVEITPLASAFDLANWQNARVRLIEEDANYFRPDGWVLGRAKARVLKVFLPIRQRPIIIGVPQWANPKFSMPDGVKIPEFASEEELTARAPVEAAAPTDALAPPLSLLDFSKEGKFDKTIQLKGARRDLRALIADIAAQAKLNLSVAPAFAPDVQVLAASEGMKTGVALSALERLYHAVWVPAGGGYVLQAQNMSEFQKMMSEMGQQLYYGPEDIGLPERFLMGARLAEEVSIKLDPEQLQSPEGALFSQLPPATQAQVIQFLRADYAGDLADKQQRVEDALDEINDFTLFFGNYPQKMTPYFVGQGSRWGKNVNFNGGIGLATFASDADGDRFMAQLFPAFSVQPPSEFDFLIAQQEAALAQREMGQ